MRKLKAVLVLVACGVVGLALLFSDLAPWEPFLLRAVEVVVVFALGGYFFGKLLPERWYLASLAALPPVVLGIFLVVVKLSTGQTPPYWVGALSVLLGPLAVCLAAARFGASRQRSGG